MLFEMSYDNGEVMKYLGVSFYFLTFHFAFKMAMLQFNEIFKLLNDFF